MFLSDTSNLWFSHLQNALFLQIHKTPLFWYFLSSLNTTLLESPYTSEFWSSYSLLKRPIRCFGNSIFVKIIPLCIVAHTVNFLCSRWNREIQWHSMFFTLFNDTSDVDYLIWLLLLPSLNHACMMEPPPLAWSSSWYVYSMILLTCDLFCSSWNILSGSLSLEARQILFFTSPRPILFLSDLCTQLPK